MFQHLVDGVFVEEPAVQCLRLNASGDTAVLIPLDRVPAFFFVVAQVFVVDAFALKFQRH